VDEGGRANGSPFNFAGANAAVNLAVKVSWGSHHATVEVPVLPGKLKPEGLLLVTADRCVRNTTTLALHCRHCQCLRAKVLAFLTRHIKVIWFYFLS
jgi:hypothetical protein